MDVWGVFREGDFAVERETRMKRIALRRGWTYRGTLERRGLDLDSIADLAAQASGGHLLLEDPSVLARDATDAILRLLLLEHLGVKASLVDTEDDPLNLALAAAQDRTTRAGTVRAAMQSRALRGLTLGKLPCGYRKSAHGQPEIDPAEAPTVQLIFDLCLQGKGIRAIVAELNTRGLTTRRGGAWSMITVRDMLRNRFYTGVYSRFGMRVSGNHPAIIPRQVFTQAQERLDAAAQQAGNAKGTPFLLSGLLYCGVCGSRMIGVTRRQSWRKKDGTSMSQRYRYYQCGSRTNRGTCSYNTRRAEELEREVLGRVRAPGEPEIVDQGILDGETWGRARQTVQQSIKNGASTAEVRDTVLGFLREASEKATTRRRAGLDRVERILASDDRMDIEWRQRAKGRVKQPSTG